LAVVALLAVVFAVMGLLGVFRQGDTGGDASSTTTADASPLAELSVAAAPDDTDGNTDPDNPPADTDQPQGEPTGANPDEADGDAAGEGTASGSGEEEGETEPDQAEDPAAPDGEAPADFCAALRQSEEALTELQVNPNDLQGMAGPMQAYLTAIQAARDLAPEEVRADLDVIVAYWEPLVAAANNPLSAPDNLGSIEIMEQYADAMTNLYSKQGALCN
jgi:hypothetical protein